MISIQQWRASIGCFFARHRGRSKISTIVVSGKPVKLGLRLLLAASLCVILAGDVETNPGPVNEIINELREFRKSVEKNFEILKNDLNELRHDFTKLESEITNVKIQVQKQGREMDNIYDELYGEICSLKHSLSRLEERTETQERYTRRDNVILYNVKGDTNETQSTTCEKVIKLLNENIPTKTWSSSDFVRLHRLKSKTPDKQPIIIRLYRSSDKLHIIKARDRFRQKGIGVGNDLTQTQRDELRDLKTKGKWGFFKNGKLQIDQNRNHSNNTNNSQSRSHRHNQSNAASSEGVSSSQLTDRSGDSQDDRDPTQSTSRDTRSHYVR